MKMTREGYPVKTILAIALILALGITGVSQWGAMHVQRMAVSSSQIYIDGIPVCVMQQGGEIVASVGMCRMPGGESREDGIRNGGDFHEGTPYPLGPRFGLPPGHPPVDSQPASEDGRRIPI
jgi:hypothetical protein